MSGLRDTETTSVVHIIVVYRATFGNNPDRAYALYKMGISQKWGRTENLASAHEFDTLGEAKRVFRRAKYVKEAKRAVIMSRTVTTKTAHAVEHARGDVVEKLAALAKGV